MSLHFLLNWAWTIWRHRRRSWRRQGRWRVDDATPPSAGTGRNGLTSGRDSGACALNINKARPGRWRCRDARTKEPRHEATIVSRLQRRGIQGRRHGHQDEPKNITFGKLEDRWAELCVQYTDSHDVTPSGKKGAWHFYGEHNQVRPNQAVKICFLKIHSRTSHHYIVLCVFVLLFIVHLIPDIYVCVTWM